MAFWLLDEDLNENWNCVEELMQNLSLNIYSVINY